MTKAFKNNPRLWALLLIVFLLLMVVAFSSGCEVLKHKRTTHQDSMVVAKKELATEVVNSGGAVRRDSTEAKERYEWLRIIQQFAQRPVATGDSVTNNYYNTYPQPATIIYETGKGERSEKSGSYDSTFYNNIMRMVAMSFDSLSRKMDQAEKDKQEGTKGLGIVTVVLIAAGVVVLLKGAGWGLSKFKIVRV